MHRHTYRINFVALTYCAVLVARTLLAANFSAHLAVKAKCYGKIETIETPIGDKFATRLAPTKVEMCK